MSDQDDGSATILLKPGDVTDTQLDFMQAIGSSGPSLVHFQKSGSSWIGQAVPSSDYDSNPFDQSPIGGSGNDPVPTSTVTVYAQMQVYFQAYNFDLGGDLNTGKQSDIGGYNLTRVTPNNTSKYTEVLNSLLAGPQTSDDNTVMSALNNGSTQYADNITVQTINVQATEDTKNGASNTSANLSLGYSNLEKMGVEFATAAAGAIEFTIAADEGDVSSAIRAGMETGQAASEAINLSSDPNTRAAAAAIVQNLNTEITAMLPPSWLGGHL